MSEFSDSYISSYLFKQREANFEHAPIDRETAFYDSIGTGNIELVRFFSTPLCSEGYGVLSKDKLRNLKYHFVVSAALIARYCINKGMTPEEAYNLSDFFIMKVDEANSVELVHVIHNEMIEKYTRHMRIVRNIGIYSKHIVKAIDYISDHLHNRITINETAEYLNISSAYLSRLFVSETGIPFSNYVNKRKSEEAANLLRFSEYSETEISNLFGFSSQSYFIKVFRKYMGMSPREYKKQSALHGLVNKEQ